MKREKKSEKNKVLVIGLDGAEPTIIENMAEEKIPNLLKLKKNGTSGNLRSTIPSATAPAWSSFMTGKNPGNTGCFDFVQRVPNSYEVKAADFEIGKKNVGLDLAFITSTMIDSKKIWDLISEANKKVGVIHVPMTYPPHKVNGFMITGLGTPGPESNFTYPPELQKKLLNDFNYKMHVTELDVDGREDIALADLYNTEQKRAEITLNLMKNMDWDFFMVVFEGVDYIQHHFWKFMDKTHPHYNPEMAKKYGNAIFDYYQRVDGYIGEILENIDENTTVIIMSDHGGGALTKNFYINQFLKDIGLLQVKEKSKKEKTLAKLGLRKDVLYRFLINFGLYKLIYKIPKFVRGLVPENEYTFSDFDWYKTKAFSVSGWGMIYINLKGREPNGIIEPGKEYEEIRNIILKKLYELEDPETGKRYVDKVFKKEDIYSGIYLDRAPDLVVKMNGIECLDRILDNKNVENKLFATAHKRKSGTHTENGIIIIKGNGIKKGYKVKNASIIDLMPTILYLLNIPIPSDIDGKVLNDIFEPTLLEENPIKYQDIKTGGEYPSKDEDDVKARLKKKGFIT